jgi:hypothetical protein
MAMQVVVVTSVVLPGAGRGAAASLGSCPAIAVDLRVSAVQRLIAEGY